MLPGLHLRRRSVLKSVDQNRPTHTRAHRQDYGSARRANEFRLFLAKNLGSPCIPSAWVMEHTMIVCCYRQPAHEIKHPQTRAGPRDDQRPTGGTHVSHAHNAHNKKTLGAERRKNNCPPTVCCVFGGHLPLFKTSCRRRRSAPRGVKSLSTETSCTVGPSDHT